MLKSPFQFLAAFEKQDKEKYFGRDTEVQLLYERVLEYNLTLVYGKSGTGKTSLIQCGLANAFESTDWFNLSIRRRDNINTSFQQILDDISVEDTEVSAILDFLGTTSIATHIPAKKETNKDEEKVEKLNKIYNYYFKPIYLIFDQFEELFILGDELEQNEFAESIQQILDFCPQVHVIFIMREEYLALLYRFEKYIPILFDNRIRVESMQRQNAKLVVNQTAQFGFELANENIVNQIIDVVSDGKFGIQLPYLQVFLERLWQKAFSNNAENILFDTALIASMGNIGDVLVEFLDDQLRIFNKEFESDKVLGIHFLKLLVSEQGTKIPRSRLFLQENLPELHLKKDATFFDRILAFFVENRILKPLENDQYELMHDSLALKIHQLNVPLYDTPTLDNPNPPTDFFSEEIDGYTEAFASVFFGRDKEIKELINKIYYEKEHQLTVLYGKGKSGKTALLRAGVIPRLRKLCEVVYCENYEVFEEMDIQYVSHTTVFVIDHFERTLTKHSNQLYFDELFGKWKNLLENRYINITIIINQNLIGSFLEASIKLKNPLAKNYLITGLSSQEFVDIFLKTCEIYQINSDDITMIQNRIKVDFNKLGTANIRRHLIDYRFTQTLTNNKVKTPLEDTIDIDIKSLGLDLIKRLFRTLLESTLNKRVLDSIRKNVYDDSLRINYVMKHIIEMLPYIMGISLRKVFSTEVDADLKLRLECLIEAYMNTVKYLNSIVLAEYVSLYYQQGGKDVSAVNQINQVLSRHFRGEGNTLNLYSSTCHSINTFLNLGYTFYVEELNKIELLETLTSQEQEFNFLQEIKTEKLQEEDLLRYVFMAEKYLANLISTLSFLANYKLVSIKNISVTRSLKFKATYVELSTAHSDILIAEINRTLEKGVEPQSVLLFKENIEDSLNLFPFILDLNAIQQARNSILYWFSLNNNIPDKIYLLEGIINGSEPYAIQKARFPDIFTDINNLLLPIIGRDRDDIQDDNISLFDF